MASSTISSASSSISHLSTINVSNFASSKLHGDTISNNYSSWKNQMLCLIESQDLLRFINGEIQPREREDFVVRRTDRLVMGWILGAVDETVPKTAANLTTARDVWLELDKMFGDPAGQLQHVKAEGKEWRDHLPLYRAALKGEWNKAEVELEQDQNAMKAKLNPTLQTALHVAVGAGKSDFVSKLVDLMAPKNLLGVKDNHGCTALHVAAHTGNTEAARILVERLPDLLHEANNDRDFPVHVAAVSRQAETLEYFIYYTKDDSPYLGESGIKLLCMLIEAKIFGIALHLAKKYPNLATERLKNGDSALKRIALKKGAFPREAILRWFYSCDREDRTTTKTGDIEGSIHPKNSNRDSWTWFKSFYEPFRYMAYLLVSVLFYEGWHYDDPAFAKKRYNDALELVKCLCKNMKSSDDYKASAIYEDAILTAARLGIHEIVEMIATEFPPAVYARDTRTEQSIFHLAAENRHKGVFDLIKNQGNIKHQMSDMRDIYGNTVLHSAAKSGSHYAALKYRSGAALQIQSEMQWFDDIKKIVQRDTHKKVNYAGKTAWEVFVEQHKVLQAQVQMWEKDTSQACSIVAGLIGAVTFAAAITMPGGPDEETHYPFFKSKLRFKAFTWCTIVSFSTSVTCLFLFLSTNISLYTEKILLPVKTILNLFFLFVSAMCMMGAFISAVYLLFDDRVTIIVFSILLLYVLIPRYFFLFDFIPLVRALQIYLKNVKRK